jgi:pyruvate,water dikinase
MDVLWLDDPACRDRSLVGGKIANLAALVGRFNVPTGFGIPSSAIERHLGAQQREQPVALPAGLGSAVGRAYRELGTRRRSGELPVAVRSSAAEEDGGQASFAGQFESYLNVVGEPRVIDAVSRCVASGVTTRVQTYRAVRAVDEGAGHRMGVFVQEFIYADASAVVFSANPVTGERNQVLINANYGLGESIVGGKATPDTFVVDKANLRVVEREVGAKEIMTVPSQGGTRDVPVPQGRQRQLSLNEEQVLEVARLARDLEEIFGWPADVECSFKDGKLHVLQCRAITTLS